MLPIHPYYAAHVICDVCYPSKEPGPSGFEAADRLRMVAQRRVVDAVRQGGRGPAGNSPSSRRADVSHACRLLERQRKTFYYRRD